jgi:hypothetical protein
MILSAVSRVAWLALGHALAGALYVGLVNLPDATALWLVVSLLTALATVLVVAVTNATALAWWSPDIWFRDALRLAVRRGPAALVVAGLLFALVWLAVGQLETWYASHRGEIDAWMISAWNTTRSSWVHTAAGALAFILRDIVGLSIALALFAAIVLRGVTAAASTGWLRAAFSREQLGVVALAVILFVALPWQVVYWRPRSVSATRAELAFVIAKLGVIYLLALVGWALMLFAAARATHRGATRGRWTA